MCDSGYLDCKDILWRLLPGAAVRIPICEEELPTETVVFNVPGQMSWIFSGTLLKYKAANYTEC